MARGRQVIDMMGLTFNRLTVIKRAENKGNKAYWICRCECGNITKPICGKQLRNGRTKSCGCLQKEKARERYNKLWEDEEHRNKISEQTKQQWQDEEYREHHIECTKKQWENEDFRNKMSGENSPNYNSNLTEEEREKGRNIDGYTEWRDEVKRQANYTCDCCGKRGNGELHSHHLDGYDWCKERRIDITNGVCLCEDCHKEFHHINGYGDNTEAQYIEFKEYKQENSDSKAEVA